MAIVDSERGQAATRSPASERRLRKRRQEARIRIRLAADAALLAGHHASAVPSAPAPTAPPDGFVWVAQAELAAMRNDIAELKAQVHALQEHAHEPSCILETSVCAEAQVVPALNVAQDSVSASMDLDDHGVDSFVEWRVVGVMQGDVLSCQHVFAEASFTAKRVRPLHPNEIITGMQFHDGMDLQWVRLADGTGVVAVATADTDIPGIPRIQGRKILVPIAHT